MLCDLVHAEITFKELARHTGLGEKTLHRMLKRDGNPTARNLGAILRSIAEDLDIRLRVQVAASRLTCGGSLNRASYLCRASGAAAIVRRRLNRLPTLR
jgi:hypothetical protein